MHLSLKNKTYNTYFSAKIFLLTLSKCAGTKFSAVIFLFKTPLPIFSRIVSFENTVFERSWLCKISYSVLRDDTEFDFRTSLTLSDIVTFIMMVLSRENFSRVWFRTYSLLPKLTVDRKWWRLRKLRERGSKLLYLVTNVILVASYRFVNPLYNLVPRAFSLFQYILSN